MNDNDLSSEMSLIDEERVNELLKGHVLMSEFEAYKQ